MTEKPYVPGWLREFYAAVDGHDPSAIARFADDMELSFGNHPVAQGRDAALRTLATASQAFTATQHEFRHVWQVGDATICEFSATYTLTGGATVTMPTAVVIERRGEQFARMRMYLDEGALSA